MKHAAIATVAARLGVSWDEAAAIPIARTAHRSRSLNRGGHSSPRFARRAP
jgi:hypothetical protein